MGWTRAFSLLTFVEGTSQKAKLLLDGSPYIDVFTSTSFQALHGVDMRTAKQKREAGDQPPAEATQLAEILTN